MALGSPLVSTRKYLIDCWRDDNNFLYKKSTAEYDISQIFHLLQSSDGTYILIS